MSDTLGKRLRIARSRTRKTQGEVCRQLGISIGTLSGYERDYRNPDPLMLFNLSEIYGVTTDYLLGKTDDPNSQRLHISTLTGQKSHAQDDKSPIKLSENERTMKIQPGTGWNLNNSEKVIHMALEQMNKENVSNVDDDIKMIPVLGTIKAGYDLYAEQQVIGMQPVAASTISDGAEYFYLVVKGDSMIDAGIKEGMRVLVRRQDAVEQGQVAVVLVNGDEGTLKRVYYQDNTIILQAANPNIPPRMMPMNDARIQGLVIKAEFDVI